MKILRKWLNEGKITDEQFIVGERFYKLSSRNVGFYRKTTAAIENDLFTEANDKGNPLPAIAVDSILFEEQDKEELLDSFRFALNIMIKRFSE